MQTVYEDNSHLVLSIITPDGEYMGDTAVEAVFLPGTSGPFEVLPMHAPIISSLVEGNLRWRELGEEKSVAVKEGFVKVLDNRVEVSAVLS